MSSAAPGMGALYVAAFAAFAIAQAAGEAFLKAKSGPFESQASYDAYAADVKVAMGEALGCGGNVDQPKLDAIEKTLLPMWRAVPKNARGRVERSLLRYLTYRYFMKTSSLMIRGLEPSRAVNTSGWSKADILSQRVPSYVESVLESRHVEEHGFDLSDVVLMVATVEQLVFDSESALLERVYFAQHKPTSRDLGRQGLEQVLEDYLVHWMMGDDTIGIQLLLDNRTMRAEAFPHWDKLVDWARGEIIAYDWKRQRRAARRSAGSLTQKYSFDDVHRIVGDVTKTFASFWESECSSMKEALLRMDTYNTGRVPLSRFYRSALDSEWRFGESESYLRDLGVLDETSTWSGKQVIIPNYIQASSNCVVSQPHYFVCCTNACESILGEIETAFGAPVAAPEEILDLVANVSAQTTVDHDDAPNLEGTLSLQLQQIAAAHGGKVPLHGRLFAQWLHYAYPRECAFPHKAGTASLKTPLEYGDGYVATEAEMQRHIDSDASSASAGTDKDESQWMSQWSSEEELIADYTQHMGAPWDTVSWKYAAMALLVVVGLLTGILGLTKATWPGALGPAGACGGEVPLKGKSHFV